MYMILIFLWYWLKDIIDSSIKLNCSDWNWILLIKVFIVYINVKLDFSEGRGGDFFYNVLSGY